MNLYRSARNFAGKVRQRLRVRKWKGHCPVCEAPTRFVALGRYYRDQLYCTRCWTIPRERALMRVLQTFYPDWRSLRIHESSPGEHGTSKKLAGECAHYTASQYVPHLPSGSAWNGASVQDLARQTFTDESFDIVVTQDVFEHLLEPAEAIREIVRTLKPGGAHIMTVPIQNKERPSERRARLSGGRIEHLKEPQYHDNPLGGGSLVTVDWGYDIADYLTAHSGCPTTIHTIDDIEQGIRAELIEVVVTRKSAVPEI